MKMKIGGKNCCFQTSNKEVLTNIGSDQKELTVKSNQALEGET